MTKRLRNFVFTWNNYTEAQYEKCLKLPYKYIVIGKEVGECGTPHLQGYCELIKQISFGKLKKLLPQVHIECRMGTAVQAAQYCKKEDKQFFEDGIISRPGKRTDLESVYELVKAGATNVEIAEAHPGTYMRSYRAIDRVRLDRARLDNKFAKVEVIVLHGPAGSGKTRKAHEIDPDLYHLTLGKDTWFDGYYGQETILIDDFYGGIKYGYILKLLDGYKFNLPIKGGFTWKQWKRVIITSNDPPHTWYQKGLTPALERRFTKVVGV